MSFLRPVCVAALLAAAAATAAADGAPTAPAAQAAQAAQAASPGGTIRFARGRDTAVVAGPVLRGERVVWRFRAREGQRATVRVTARERNAAFEIWRPGAVLPADFTQGDVQGRALEGAAPGDDATRWTGTLPEGGEYLVLVGATRGNASYRLTLKLN